MNYLYWSDKVIFSEEKRSYILPGEATWHTFSLDPEYVHLTSTEITESPYFQSIAEARNAVNRVLVAVPHEVQVERDLTNAYHLISEADITDLPINKFVEAFTALQIKIDLENYVPELCEALKIEKAVLDNLDPMRAFEVLYMFMASQRNIILNILAMATEDAWRSTIGLYRVKGGIFRGL